MSHRHPLQNPEVCRRNQQSVKITWRFASDPCPVKIFDGPVPEAIDRKHPVAATAAGDQIVLNHLDPGRPHYFALVTENAPALIVSERRLPLEGAVNFRDLGGYRTADGRRVKWGLIFRSDNLARLTERDLSFLGHLNIATICDFRTEAETERSPNLLPGPDTIYYSHMPIQHGEHDPATAFERIKKGDYQWLSEEFMVTGYIRSIDHFSPLWHDFFELLTSSEHRPVVFHCTGGKDRTGTAAALVLSVLGVPEKTIVEDYALSAEYIAGVLKMINGQLEEMGVDPREVAPYFTVTPDRMWALLEHIRMTYGSAVDYLVKTAGVDPKAIKQFREELLVDP